MRYIIAVLWSFLGIRNKKRALEDEADLKVIHLILSGIIIAALFVCSLQLIIYLII